MYFYDFYLYLLNLLNFLNFHLNIHHKDNQTITLLSFCGTKIKDFK